MMIDDRTRRIFDALLEQVMEELPDEIHALIEEVPLVVEDHPSKRTMREMEIESPDELCGLHDGVPLTERGSEDLPTLPDTITIYRLGILSLVRAQTGDLDRDELRRQIRITILHEIGHHFGLDEEDLEALGYG